MVDVPNGSVKSMRRLGVKPTSINGLLVSHFHADHFFDIVFLLLELGLRQVRDTSFPIVGPPDLENRVRALFKLAYPESMDRVLANSQVEFIEIQNNGEQVEVDGFKIRAWFVSHTVENALGFEIEQNGIVVGFSGDSEMCEGIEKICQNSRTAFLDTSFLTPRKGHMGWSDIIGLLENYPELTIVATHMSDEIAILPPRDRLIIPNDGDEIDG